MAAKKNKPNVVAIDQLVPDNANANRGTLYGQELLRKSFRELGAGKSVLLDKNNRLIAGNKSTDAAKMEGIKDVIIVDTEGDVLVAVRRKDLSLDSKRHVRRAASAGIGRVAQTGIREGSDDGVCKSD